MILSEHYKPPTEKEEIPPIEGLCSAAAAIRAGFAAGLKPPPPMDLLDWAVQNVRFEDGSPMPGPYNPDKFPYFTEILRRLQPDDPCREVTVKGSAQIGKTVIGMVFTGASLDLDPCAFMYIHPTLDNGKLWDDTKWQPFVEQTKDLRLAFSNDKSRDNKNRAFFKMRKDKRGFLRISGANSSSSLSMITIRRMVKDDLSKWVNNEAGDPDAQANSRMGSYEFDAKCLNISTPLQKDACRISDKYNKSDMRKRFVPCPHCDHKHPLEWENFRNSIRDDMDPADAHFTCPACGGVIEQKHRAAMLARGEWVPTQTDRKREPGYAIWQAYSSLRSWASIAAGWINAKGDPETEQTFYNDVLGLEYEVKGEAPPWENIAKRAKESPYHQGIIPPNALLLCLGIDVQGDRIEWLLQGFGPNRRRYTIQAGVIEYHISDERAISQLDGLMRRKWRNFLGREHQVDMAAIDMGYEANDVKAWAKRWPVERVIVVKGRGDGNAPPIWAQIEKSDNGKTEKKSRRLWNVGTSGIKSSLYKNLEKIDPLKAGYCGFANDLDDEHFKQLCSEHRVLKHKKSGIPDVSWEKIGDLRNEILDMNVYAEAAARRLNWTTAPEEEWERLRAEREKAPDHPQLELLVDVLKTAASAVAIAAMPPAAPPAEPPMESPPEKTVNPGRRMRSKGI